MDFQRDVIQRSHEIPVLVDFWAEWCGPCRILGPVLEELDREDERWELVKVDTEEHQEEALAYRVMSIPNVKLFFKGEVIGEFVGALPKIQVQKWLDENLPDEARQEWMDLAAREGDWPDALFARQLGDFIQRHPDHDEAYLALARHMVLKTPDEAVDIIHARPLMKYSPETVEDIKAIAELVQYTPEAGSGKTGEMLGKASDLLREDRLDDAIKALVDTVMIDKSVHNNLPQRACVALFRMLGQNHEITRKYRKLFEMALY